MVASIYGNKYYCNTFCMITVPNYGASSSPSTSSSPSCSDDIDEECDYYNEQLIQSICNDLAAKRAGSTTSATGASSSGAVSSSAIVNAASQYIGANEGDGSYLKFTDGRSEAWCADFVTYAVKQAYASQGKSVPDGFGSPSVSGLQSWGEEHGCYVDASQTSSVKAGDIVIYGSGSHTGIVTAVNSDGTIDTIEGNTSDQNHQIGSDCVSAKSHHSMSNVTGFVLMSKLS